MANINFNLGQFVTEHPIISFLVADKVITGAINLADKAISGKKNCFSKSGKTIDVDSFDIWYHNVDARLNTLETKVKMHDDDISTVNESLDRLEESFKKLAINETTDVTVVETNE